MYYFLVTAMESTECGSLRQHRFTPAVWGSESGGSLQGLKSRPHSAALTLVTPGETFHTQGMGCFLATQGSIDLTQLILGDIFISSSFISSARFLLQLKVDRIWQSGHGYPWRIGFGSRRMDILGEDTLLASQANAIHINL